MSYAVDLTNNGIISLIDFFQATLTWICKSFKAVYKLVTYFLRSLYYCQHQLGSTTSLTSFT